MYKYELPTLRFSKVIVWQTDRQTESTDTMNHAALRVVNTRCLAIAERPRCRVHY